MYLRVKLDPQGKQAPKKKKKKKKHTHLVALNHLQQWKHVRKNRKEEKTPRIGIMLH
jgi:hypothetical protein